MAARKNIMHKLFDYTGYGSDRPYICISLKIEREPETFYAYDLETFFSLIYTFKHWIHDDLVLSKVFSAYSITGNPHSMYVEFRGGGYGEEIRRYKADPTTYKRTPGHQRCFYSEYRKKFYMQYKDYWYEIPQPYNLTPEEEE